MKKRIVAILLSLSVFCFSLSCGKRASAAPAVGAIMAIGVLAWEIIGVCTGMYDDTAAAIGEFIESGVDGFINPDSEFQQNWSAGWNTICNTVEGWFNNGDLQIENGQIKLTYDQFHELYGQVISVTSKPDIKFQSDYDYAFFSVDLSKPFTGSDLPQLTQFIVDLGRQSYAPIYFNDEKIVFSDHFIYNSRTDNGRSYSTSLLYFTSSSFTLSSNDNVLNVLSVDFNSFYDVYRKYPCSFYMPQLNNVSVTTSFEPFKNNHYSYENCFIFENGTLSFTALSDIDTTGMSSGLLTTYNYDLFLRSIKGYTPSLVPPANLDDLSDVLPTEYNPTLSFPVDPDLTRPLPNQVIVGDVPGVADLPLSEYQAEIKTEIEVPSIICTKFPFCIPYDFIRFLGLLCSDPVAPVFRIPISTSPDNLEQWSGNVTVNEYLDPDDLMFEIDEEIVIDLSVIPLVQPICYTCFIVGFIFLLLHITPKMIQH